MFILVDQRDQQEREKKQMSQKLESFKFNSSSSYPWSEWFDGSIYQIKQHEDFECELTSMRSMIHSRAAQREGSVQTSVDKKNKTITFKFSK